MLSDLLTKSDLPFLFVYQSITAFINLKDRFE